MVLVDVAAGFGRDAARYEGSRPTLTEDANGETLPRSRSVARAVVSCPLPTTRTKDLNGVEISRQTILSSYEHKPYEAIYIYTPSDTKRFCQLFLDTYLFVSDNFWPYTYLNR